MSFEPIIPLAWVLIVTLVVACASVWRRTTPTAAVLLRMGALLGLALVVLGPVAPAPAPAEPRRPTVVVLADRSASMGSTLGVLDSGWWASDAFAALNRGADVRLVDHAGNGFRPGSKGTSKTDTTPLVRAIEGVLRGTPDHVVLLSDGIDTSGASVVSVKPGTTRVHALLVESGGAIVDARVTLSAERGLVYAGQPVALTARLTHSGLAGRRADLVLTEGGRDIERRAVTLGDGAALERFETMPTSGADAGVATVAYEARLVPLAGEASAANNASTALVRVSAEPIRVLVLEGQPHWDTRFFVRAMRADGRVEVTVATTLENRFASPGGAGRVRVERTGVPGDEGVRAAPALPATSEDLAYYDVVVLGRGVEQFFPGRSAREIVAYAREGLGSVVFLRGEPIASDEPEALRALGALEEMYAGAVERRLGAGDLRRFGGGVTLFVDDPGAYRRALLAPGAGVERDAYARGWSGVVRTLAINAPIPPGEDASLRVFPLSGPPGTAFEIALRARDRGYAMPASASVAAPGGDAVRVTLVRGAGETVRASGVFTAREEGVHRVAAGDGLGAAFVVVEDRAEFLDLRPRREELRALARESGGVTFGPEDGAGAVLATVEGLRAAAARETVREPVWDTWWLWGAIVLCLCGEWAVRRFAAGGAL